MRRVVWSLVSVIGFSLSAASAATHDDAASACADRDPDIAIIACSALIDSGGEAPGELSRDLNNRGGAYSAKGDYDLAITDLDQSIKLDSENAGAYINRGNSYGAKKEYDRALDDYGQALRIRPQDSGAYSARGNVYEHLGQPITTRQLASTATMSAL
jgi:tetratricopeptide (TPR) repeat protein